jgi:hypothetical protein
MRANGRSGKESAEESGWKNKVPETIIQLIRMVPTGCASSATTGAT